LQETKDELKSLKEEAKDLRAQVSTLLIQKAALQTKLEAYELYRCEKFTCPNRIPPFATSKLKQSVEDIATQ